MSDPKPLVELTIDGKPARVPEGTNVLEAAKTVGIRVPNFCYHPDLTWEGSCRMCLVHIEGRPKLTVSCCEKVTPGMVVRVFHPEAEKARRAQLEFLLLNHPLDCPICDKAGECKLQDYYVEHGRYHSRMPRGLKVHKKKVVDLGERIVLDKERCVLCSRCVRFTREVSGTHQLQFFTRGVTTEIGTEGDQPMVDAYSDNVVDICPVGALTAKDFRFRQRVWFLRSTESVCAHCSTGCNLRVDHKDGVIYRFVPRRNPEVNRSWMCNLGRDSYKLLQGQGRLSQPWLRRDGRLETVTWEEALKAAEAAVALARASGAAAALASPDASTETLFLFKRFAREVLRTGRLDYRATPAHARTGELDDGILHRADPHPNHTGCRLLGLAQTASPDAVLEACERGEVKVLYLLGSELLAGHADPERVRRALARVEHVVTHARREAPGLALATLVLPDAVHTEYDGTFVNYQGRVQRFKKALGAAAEIRPAAEVLAELAARAGVALPGPGAAERFAAMAAAEPAFQGLEFQKIGLEGVLAAAPAEPVASRSA